MDTRVRALFVAAAIFCSAAMPASALSDTHHRPLRSYMAKVNPQIKTYFALGKRATEVLSQDPSEDVGRLVDGLSDVSARFDRLAARWDTIKAPPGLGLKHRGMGGAFRLESRFFAAFADAWSQFAASGDPAVLTDLTTRTDGMARSAVYLQRRWAGALEGALVRASLAVPRWLEQMATLKP